MSVTRNDGFWCPALQCYVTFSRHALVRYAERILKLSEPFESPAIKASVVHMSKVTLRCETAECLKPPAKYFDAAGSVILFRTPHAVLIINRAHKKVLTTLSPNWGLTQADVDKTVAIAKSRLDRRNIRQLKHVRADERRRERKYKQKIFED